MRLLVTAVLFATFTPVASGAPPMRAPGTAGGLADSCRALSEIFSQTNATMTPDEEGARIGAAGYCLGFVKGFRYGHLYLSTLVQQAAFCIPHEVTEDQIARVVVKRVESHPEIEHVESPVFLAEVLSSTWPCR